jgi:SAM-dependent methyltransferase
LYPLEKEASVKNCDSKQMSVRLSRGDVYTNVRLLLGGHLKVSDSVINAIEAGELNPGNISFAEIRRLASRDSGCWDDLGRGRAILGSIDHLDQYLYSYGPLTQGQWSIFLSELDLELPEDTDVRIVDYGCGQGLATALLFDNYGLSLRTQTSQVVLVEPSALALKRAGSVLGTYCEHANIHPVNKKLDDLEKKDLKVSSASTNLHIFSNVLDINGFDRVAVFNRIFKTPGKHIILAVSHNRDHHGGSARIRTLDEAVRDPKYSKWLRIKTSNISEFDCPNGMPAISWELKLEVFQ